MSSQSNLALGTSSWTFKEWKGLFYPEKLPAKKHLAHYSCIFNSVEVNTSFYALPKATTVQQWMAAVPEGFTFSLKFPRIISHEKRLVKCEEETLAYLALVQSFGTAAAPGLLQLPPSFTRAKSGLTLARYLDWLAEQLHDSFQKLQVAVEVRSRDLMTRPFAMFLAERGMGLALVDRLGTEDMRDIWLELADAQQTPLFTFIRWIGDDKNGPKGNRELSNPRDTELEGWSTFIQRCYGIGHDIYGYMHNPYEGYSPESVRRLQSCLQAHAQTDFPIWSSNETIGAVGVQGELFGS